MQNQWPDYSNVNPQITGGVDVAIAPPGNISNSPSNRTLTAGLAYGSRLTVQAPKQINRVKYALEVAGSVGDTSNVGIYRWAGGNTLELLSGVNGLDNVSSLGIKTVAMPFGLLVPGETYFFVYHQRLIASTVPQVTGVATGATTTANINNMLAPGAGATQYALGVLGFLGNIDLPVSTVNLTVATVSPLPLAVIQ